MAGIGKFKLSDAIGKPAGSPSKSVKKAAKGQAQATAAEQAREALEAAQAKNAEASIRGHMVEIGRGNQQAGRQQGGGRRGK
ncbi:hypothetical protein [Planctomyces sp. SH-PL62]|uniref:hypothetical protein n=1 Tax=Planctomyces sp. SH-PL62 TaxID=1636152 RepID=UPI00078BA534|nr:hypothetical protein [Planctomyces sp. SH-PL62]AMV37331.1 hypothetical protein VT85_07850 [Planctomyces sp. SH-PL62]